MKLKRNLFLVLVWALLALCVPAFGLLILEPGYTVETYTSYSPTTTYTYSMTFDNAGNLYLNQPFDDKIWRVRPDRTTSEFASLSDTTSGFDWSGGPVYGDYLYVTANRDMVRIAPDGTTSTFASGFPAASEVAVDRTGNYGGYIFVSTGGQDHIYRVDTGGKISMFSNWPDWTSGGGPVGLEFDTNGNYNKQMYVATIFGQSNADKSGLFVLDTAGNASRFCDDLVAGLEIAFDTVGLFGQEMFVVGTDAWDYEYRIWRIAPNGSATEFAASTGEMIGSLVFGPDGALYVSEYSAVGQVITVSRIIPEPTTVLLLSLGAVMLRRKQ